VNVDEHEAVLRNQLSIAGYGVFGRSFLEARVEPVFSRPTVPDFNPIELAFSKLKAFLRVARPRSFDQVTELVAAALAPSHPQNVGITSGTAAIGLLYRSENAPVCEQQRWIAAQ
jgi:hypothetical protein